MITAPVFCAARMIPGFGIFSGPLGPSGVIAIKDGGLFNTFTISGKISDPPLELHPQSSRHPSFDPILEISSASRLVPVKP